MNDFLRIFVSVGNIKISEYYHFDAFILFIRIDIEGVNIHNMMLAYDYIWALSHLIKAQFFHAV